MPLIGCIRATPFYEKLPHIISFVTPCLTVFCVHYWALHSVLGGRLTYCLSVWHQIKQFCFGRSPVSFLFLRSTNCSWANFKRTAWFFVTNNNFRGLVATKLLSISCQRVVELLATRLRFFWFFGRRRRIYFAGSYNLAVIDNCYFALAPTRSSFFLYFNAFAIIWSLQP